MFRTLQVPVAVCVAIVAVAVVLAIHDDKVANLVIAAACVSCTVVGVSLVLRRLIEDAYDSGGRSERRAIAREVAELMRQEDTAAKR